MVMHDQKHQKSGRQAQNLPSGRAGIVMDSHSSNGQLARADLANRSARVSQLMAFQERANDSPQARQTTQLRKALANRTQNSGVVQRVTGVGVVGGLGAIAAGAGLVAGAPYLATAGLAVAGGSALYKWLRGAPKTSAPASNLDSGKRADLAEYRRAQGINPLDVQYDAAFTDEVAGRRREKDAYRQWQIGSANQEGQALGKNGQPLPAGRYMYVVTTGNEFRYLPMKKIKGHPAQYRTHSQLSGKQQVYAAGAFNVGEDGHITEIDNESGHYRPGKIENAEYAKKLLGHLGVEVASTKTTLHNPEKDPKGAVKWLMAQGQANIRALRTWLPQKEGTGWKHGLAEPSSELEQELPF
jgi:hypothetical protein